MMKNGLMLVAACWSSGAFAQAAPVAPLATVSPAMPVPSVLLLLRRDTPVELMAPKEVSTADATAGEIFKLRVNRAIEVDGKVVVPVGTPAFGQVVAATDSGGLGKSGRMTAKLLHIQLGNVEIPLEGEMSAKGTGAGSAGVAFLFIGVVGLFHRGNNAKIKAGEIVAGFVGEDVALDMSGASPTRAAPAVAAPAAPIAPAGASGGPVSR